MKDEVLDFIKRRWQLDSHWLDGNCYWFAFILTTRFPQLEIWYLPIEGHFVAGAQNKFYDWTGLVEPKEKPYKLSWIRLKEPNMYKNLVRNCMN